MPLRTQGHEHRDNKPYTYLESKVKCFGECKGARGREVKTLIHHDFEVKRFRGCKGTRIGINDPIPFGTLRLNALQNTRAQDKNRRSYTHSASKCWIYDFDDE